MQRLLCPWVTTSRSNPGLRSIARLSTSSDPPEQSISEGKTPFKDNEEAILSLLFSNTKENSNPPPTPPVNLQSPTPTLPPYIKFPARFPPRYKTSTTSSLSSSTDSTTSATTRPSSKPSPSYHNHFVVGSKATPPVIWERLRSIPPPPITSRKIDSEETYSRYASWAQSLW